ncbi:serine/threonine protein kinase [Streptomyces herbicida]|uniref:serine/threonine protein kinase n=1 Tax=Streptomyces herbicida TaxID=3065675 RepID=UPI0029312C39|nr:serine/threonine-protein kinase [Streptomyces sp. NEAU-HV9]
MTMGKAHVSGQELVAGRYRLLEVVHRETNRICWYAEDLEAQRPRLVTQTELPDRPAEETARRTTARVLRTTELMGMLRPGRVATVIDAIEDSGTLWTVIEWIDGIPLGELLSQQSALNYVRAARIGLELLDVLEAAHGEGFTHGELSPGQVFVRDQGPVVVTGFGLAGATLAPRVTAPSYAAPEQARDERLGPAADLWALGAILYTMVEGRPPFRDRGRPDTTLRAVERLPLRTPLRAGPLARVVQGLLRKDCRERLTGTVVREALMRILAEDADADREPAPVPRLRGAYLTALRAGRGWSRRTMAVGTALAVLTVSAAVLAVTHGLPGTGTSDTAGSATRPSAAADPTGNRTDGNGSRTPAAPAPTPTPTPGSATPTATASTSPSATSNALPTGYRRYTAPEGFSVALPDGWTRQATAREGDRAYRVTFGPGGDDPRTLAVTYSSQVGPDPVAVWRDEVQPDLARTDGFQRIGDIEATTYQGYKGADMEWFSGSGSDRARTFGRGFLIGGRHSFSLRFTAPADDWNTAADRLAPKTFLGTFRIAQS